MLKSLLFPINRIGPALEEISKVSLLLEASVRQEIIQAISYLGLGCLALNSIILAAIYIGLRFIKPRYPKWWEQWIAAPYPDEFE
jgi:hypothetical protein